MSMIVSSAALHFDPNPGHFEFANRRETAFFERRAASRPRMDVLLHHCQSYGRQDNLHRIEAGHSLSRWPDDRFAWQTRSYLPCEAIWDARLISNPSADDRRCFPGN